MTAKGAGVEEPNPRVRRLCVATTARTEGLLASACRSAGVGRLCVTADLRNCTEIAFAPPGVDEFVVVTRLIAALTEEAVRPGPGAAGPLLAAFHVGITRIEGEGFGGEAAARTRGLLFDQAIRSTAVGKAGKLVVIVSDTLYRDLRTEGLSVRGWQNVPAAGAWIWCSETLPPVSASDSLGA